MDELKLNQYLEVREKMGWYDRSNTGKLAIRGADRFTWLQGMVSADTKSLANNRSHSPLPACLLDSTGHLLAELHLYSAQGGHAAKIGPKIGLGGEDFILIDMQRSELEKVVSTLDRFLISEDVEIIDVSDRLGCVAAIGNHAYQHWDTAPEGKPLDELLPFSYGMITNSAPNLFGFVAYYPAEYQAQVEEIMARQEALNIDEETFELLRVEAGSPKYGVDMDEKTIALEAGLGPTHISFTKGCYVGQEVIARIDSRGHTNRALTGFVIHSETLPEPKAKLFAETEEGWKETGWLTSVVAESPAMDFRPIALGYARHEHRAPGTTLHIGEPESGRTVQTIELPFFRGAKS